MMIVRAKKINVGMGFTVLGRSGKQMAQLSARACASLNVITPIQSHQLEAPMKGTPTWVRLPWGSTKCSGQANVQGNQMAETHQTK